MSKIVQTRHEQRVKRAVMKTALFILSLVYVTSFPLYTYSSKHELPIRFEIDQISVEHLVDRTHLGSFESLEGDEVSIDKVSGVAETDDYFLVLDGGKQHVLAFDKANGQLVRFLGRAGNRANGPWDLHYVFSLPGLGNQLSLLNSNLPAWLKIVNVDGDLNPQRLSSSLQYKTPTQNFQVMSNQWLDKDALVVLSKRPIGQPLRQGTEGEKKSLYTFSLLELEGDDVSLITPIEDAESLYTSQRKNAPEQTNSSIYVFSEKVFRRVAWFPNANWVSQDGEFFWADSYDDYLIRVWGGRPLKEEAPLQFESSELPLRSEQEIKNAMDTLPMSRLSEIGKSYAQVVGLFTRPGDSTLWVLPGDGFPGDRQSEGTQWLEFDRVSKNSGTKTRVRFEFPELDLQERPFGLHPYRDQFYFSESTLYIILNVSYYGEEWIQDIGLDFIGPRIYAFDLPETLPN